MEPEAENKILEIKPPSSPGTSMTLGASSMTVEKTVLITVRTRLIDAGCGDGNVSGSSVARVSHFLCVDLTIVNV